MEKTYKLYTDGSHRPLHNMAGYGGYVEDENMETFLEFSEVIHDHALFNHFEKLGLKRGLQLCLEKGIKNLVCYTDDIQLVKKFNVDDEANRYVIEDSIIDHIFQLRDQFENISFHYLPRDQNKKADKLSHRAMDQLKAVQGHIIVEGGFVPCKLDFIEKHEQKENFNILANNIEHTIVFQTIQDKNSINVYLVKKDLTTNELESQLLNSYVALNKTSNLILDIVNKTLESQVHLKDCAFFMEGIKSDELQKIFKGFLIPTKKLKEKLELFEEITSKFDNLIYFRDKKVFHAVTAPIKEADNPIVKNKEFFLLALKELGQPDYYIGKNEQIENAIPVKNSKKNSVAEIQKLYFAEYLKKYVDSFRDEYNVPIRRKKREVMEEVKEQLMTQGIKLRM